MGNHCCHWFAWLVSKYFSVFLSKHRARKSKNELDFCYMKLTVEEETDINLLVR
jgi:hypothetical protein